MLNESVLGGSPDMLAKGSIDILVPRITNMAQTYARGDRKAKLYSSALSLVVAGQGLHSA